MEQGHAPGPAAPGVARQPHWFITLNWGYLRPVSEVTLLLDAIEAGEP
ncbi:MAG: hypothetical protein U1G08_16780 [Verrucomicrobiota bacterium]